jgi:hypothetical protein
MNIFKLSFQVCKMGAVTILTAQPSCQGHVRELQGSHIVWCLVLKKWIIAINIISISYGQDGRLPCSPVTLLWPPMPTRAGNPWTITSKCWLTLTTAGLGARGYTMLSRQFSMLCWHDHRKACPLGLGCLKWLNLGGWHFVCTRISGIALATLEIFQSPCGMGRGENDLKTSSSQGQVLIEFHTSALF